MDTAGMRRIAFDEIKTGMIVTWGDCVSNYAVLGVSIDRTVVTLAGWGTVRDVELSDPIYQVTEEVKEHEEAALFPPEEISQTKPRKKTTSDGGSTSYYFLPDGAEDLNDLIEAKGMSFARGNVFKALFRLGEKEGIDTMYDLKKIEHFVQRMKLMVQRGQDI